MNERIVVSCRMNGEEVSRPESRYLDRARSLTQHAEALGATLAAWSATTLAFAWDTDSLEEAIEFVCEVAGAPTPVWACAIARGELEPLAGSESADKGRGRADLAWGHALFAAVILARAARAGEALVEASFAGLDALVPTGNRIAHDGERRVRGVRIDTRQPWKRDVGPSVERLVPPAFLGRPDPRSLLARPGLVHVVRADPGRGGTRMLAEIAHAVEPGPCIVVAPTGASVEPLGALRRALVRALATRPYPEDPELGPALDMFLGGIGASIEQASAIVGALMRPRTPTEPPGALLLDDAGEIDAESLEACAQVVAWMSSPFHVFLRIDATDQIPAPFAALPAGKEIELGPLDREGAEALARGATGGALSRRTASRMARRSSFIPLAIVESLAFGLTTGDIVWVGGRASLRTAASLAGKPGSAARWISKRAKATASDERGVLATIALLGGEAPIEAVRDSLKVVEEGINVEEEIRKLLARHWLVQTLPGWVALPSRTHRDTIADLLDEKPRRVLHRAIADVLEHSEGELGCAEAAHHAVKAGEGERGARLALRAARAAQAAGMSKSASRLLTLARLADPKCEPLTRQQLLTSLPPPIMPPSGPPSSLGRAAMLPSEPTLQRPVEPSVLAPPPPPAPLIPPATPPPPEDAPTARVTVLSAAQAAHLIQQGAREDDRDSDFPTVINAPAFAVERPVAAEALSIDRPTTPDPIPAYVLHPPPSKLDRAGQSGAGPMSRPSTRGMAAVVPPRSTPGESPALPKPMAPLPLRPSVQAMPAVLPRVPAPERVPPRPDSAPGGVAPRRAVQMPAVRPPPNPPPPVPVAASVPDPPPSEAFIDRVIDLPRAPAGGAPSPLPPPLLTPAPHPPASLPAVAAASVPATNGEDARGVAGRMIDLAKSALLEGDAAGIERWTEGIRAAGDHDRLADRIEAIARIARGQVGEALRSLRALKEGAGASSPVARAQASLALGLALAAANRPEEALLAGLDALARAREGADDRAVNACFAFLAKLYGRAERRDEAAALLGAAPRAG